MFWTNFKNVNETQKDKKHELIENIYKNSSNVLNELFGELKDDGMNKEIRFRTRDGKQLPIIKSKIQYSQIMSKIDSNIRILLKYEIISERQAEILRLITRNYTAQEISERLDLKIRTVQHHCKRIYKSLNVHSRYELMLCLQSILEGSNSDMVMSEIKKGIPFDKLIPPPRQNSTPAAKHRKNNKPEFMILITPKRPTTFSEQIYNFLHKEIKETKYGSI